MFDFAWDVLHDHQYIFRRYVTIVIKVKSSKVKYERLHFESHLEQLIVRSGQDLAEIFEE